ncbi:hypothetical protein RRG08_015056 [Elysia crispata]|uniref:Uncharacterized protein n=1 Tax=Elysia crispata TaxID=231223 RepID=A0AAE1B640_9GAST|nr:hypothetical protein RRG08_015056 [Elysia crispata]
MKSDQLAVGMYSPSKPTQRDTLYRSRNTHARVTPATAQHIQDEAFFRLTFAPVYDPCLCYYRCLPKHNLASEASNGGICIKTVRQSISSIPCTLRINAVMYRIRRRQCLQAMRNCHTLMLELILQLDMQKTC